MRCMNSALITGATAAPSPFLSRTVMGYSSLGQLITSARGPFLSPSRSVCLAARLAAASRRVILRCSRPMMEGSRQGTKRDLLAQVPQVRGRRWVCGGGAGGVKRVRGEAAVGGRGGGDPREGDEESLACFHTLARQRDINLLYPLLDVLFFFHI